MQGRVYDAIAFGSLKKTLQPVLRRIGLDLYGRANTLETDRRLRIDAHGTPEIHLTLDSQFDGIERDPHRRRDHPQRDLLAGGEGSEQQISRAGKIPFATR